MGVVEKSVADKVYGIYCLDEDALRKLETAHRSDGSNEQRAEIIRCAKLLHNGNNGEVPSNSSPPEGITEKAAFLRFNVARVRVQTLNRMSESARFLLSHKLFNHAADIVAEDLKYAIEVATDQVSHWTSGFRAQCVTVFNSRRPLRPRDIVIQGERQYLIIPNGIMDVDSREYIDPERE